MFDFMCSLLLLFFIVFVWVNIYNFESKWEAYANACLVRTNQRVINLCELRYPLAICQSVITFANQIWVQIKDIGISIILAAIPRG